MKVRPGIEAAALTDLGCLRHNNEDNYAYWESREDAGFERLGRLAIVADGMGGAEGGQFASRIAVDAVCETYAAAGPEAPQGRLIAAFLEANRRVRQEARAKPLLHGMGTTLTAGAILGRELYFAHIGDSRLFLVRNGICQQLTRDHSLVARLIESGTIRPEEAETHPQKHVLTAAIGVAEDLQPDVPPSPIQLATKDVLVLCTDGLWGQMTPGEIAEVVSKTNPRDACKRLVRLAKDRGGPDNITVQVLHVSA
jgi:serine/threonine protein phosphatase PrpC